MLLHGEQYLEIASYPIPTSGTLISSPKLLEVVDKGNAAVVKIGTTTTEKETGRKVFYNEQTVFLRGSGGFGGERKGEDRGNSTRGNKIPERDPDSMVEEKTTEEQAVLYRLSGDVSVSSFNLNIYHGLMLMINSTIPFTSTQHSQL